MDPPPAPPAPTAPVVLAGPTLPATDLLKMLLSTYALAFNLEACRASGSLDLVAPPADEEGSLDTEAVARAFVAKRRLHELRTTQKHLHAHRFHNWANRTTMSAQAFLFSTAKRTQFFGYSLRSQVSLLDVSESALSIRHRVGVGETKPVQSAAFEERRWVHLLRSTIRTTDAETLVARDNSDSAASLWSFVQKLLVKRNGFKLSSHHKTSDAPVVRTASILDDDHYCMVTTNDTWQERWKDDERPHRKFPYALGAASVADRLFVNRGFLTPKEVRAVATRVLRKKYAAKGWWGDASPEDLEFSTLRMSGAYHERFVALRHELESLVSSARRTDSTNDSSAARASATSRRSPFGHALVDFKFLHVLDMAMNKEQAYTFDDVVLHAMDVHRRAKSFEAAVRTKTKLNTDPAGRLRARANKIGNPHERVAEHPNSLYKELRLASVAKTQAAFKDNALVLSRNVNLLVAAQLHLLASRPEAPPLFKYVVLGGSAQAQLGTLPAPNDFVVYWKERIEDPTFVAQLRALRDGASTFPEPTRARFDLLESNIAYGRKLLEEARLLDLELEFVLQCGQRLLKHATTDVRQRDARVAAFVTRPLDRSEDGRLPSHSAALEFANHVAFDARLGLVGGFGDQRLARSRLEVVAVDVDDVEIGVARGTVMQEGFESNLSRGWRDPPMGNAALSGVQRRWAENASKKVVDVNGFYGEADALAREMLSHKESCMYNLPHWTALLSASSGGDGPFDAPKGPFGPKVPADVVERACAAIRNSVAQGALVDAPHAFADAKDYVAALVDLESERPDVALQLTAAIGFFARGPKEVNKMTGSIKNFFLTERFPWEQYRQMLSQKTFGDEIAAPSAEELTVLEQFLETGK